MIGYLQFVLCVFLVSIVAIISGLIFFGIIDVVVWITNKLIDIVVWIVDKLIGLIFRKEK